MRAIIANLLALGFLGSAYGHHSFDYHFNREVSVSIEGTVDSFRFVNPHARILIDVTGEDGQVVTWDCEMQGSNGLARRGWSEDLFQPGQAIKLSGFGHRRSDTECYFDVAILEDGTRIALDDRIGEDVQTRTQAVASTRLEIGGAPNFSRVWERQGGGGMGPRLGGPNREAWVLSEAGRRALEAYDSVFDDPALECNPVSIARLWGTGDPTEIRQEDDRVIIHHEWMDTTREIHLDQETHPENMPECVLGHSIGWYEDATLVIDTQGYQAGMFRQHPGLPHSDQLHTVERITLSDDGRSFDVEWMAEDTEYFTGQLTGDVTLEISDDEIQQYNCTHPSPMH